MELLTPLGGWKCLHLLLLRESSFHALMMFHLSMFADNSAACIVLSKEEKGRLQLMNAALRISNKSTYTSWVRYF